MKTSLTLALALVSIAVSTFSIRGQSPEATASMADKPKSQLVAPKHRSDKETVVTGSHIRRKAHRRGVITDGTFNVSVIDSEMIRRSGFTGVQQLLVHGGFGR